MIPEPLSPEIDRVARAIRFALVCVLLVLSYFSIRGSLVISEFKRIFADMLDGSRLSPVTSLVIASRWVFLTASVVVPVGALITLRDRHVLRSFYVIGTLALITLVQIALLYQALCAPLFTLLDQLGATSAK
jgi:hypothetical protein